MFSWWLQRKELPERGVWISPTIVATTRIPRTIVTFLTRFRSTMISLPQKTTSFTLDARILPIHQLCHLSTAARRLRSLIVFSRHTPVAGGKKFSRHIPKSRETRNLKGSSKRSSPPNRISVSRWRITLWPRK
jgi:hypothetical protein